MKPKTFMVIAGEASGDLLAAELVQALRDELSRQALVFTTDYQPLKTTLAPRFFGAGGPRMAEVGVELAFDLTAHSVIGLSDVLWNYQTFRRLFRELYHLALAQEPDAIICVDFSGFNRRFAHAVRRYVRARRSWFQDWNPKIIQYVSPQVWASREGRAYQMAKDYDLLLSIFPFEQAWYARRVPQFQVEFVGHPMLDRYAKLTGGPATPTFGNQNLASHAPPAVHAQHAPPAVPAPPALLLLPGSRPSELARHLPVMLGALEILQREMPSLRARMVLPNERLVEQARTFQLPASLELQTGGLPEALGQAELAIASTGTVTMECAFFGVPTVALYRTSWATYQVGKRIVKVNYLAMPNLLADEPIFPEFIQDAATAQNLAGAALELLRDEPRRREIKRRLHEIVASLGGPGASRRAAQAILRLGL